MTLQSIIATVLCLGISVTFASDGFSQQEAMKLPDPRTSGGQPFFDVLKNRRTIREFKTDMLSRQDLSNLLWAAWGINRPDSGRRTAPTWANFQEFTIFVATKDGVWRWDDTDNTLYPHSTEDIRPLTQNRDFTTVVPVMLVYVADYDKMQRAGSDRERELISWTDAGFISQNVYLYCAAEGLATVVMGGIDREAVSGAMKLGPSQHVVHTQAVGYPAQ